MKACKVCGAIQGQGCIEVFGITNGVELGCTACIGVTHFPFTVQAFLERIKDVARC